MHILEEALINVFYLKLHRAQPCDVIKPHSSGSLNVFFLRGWRWKKSSTFQRTEHLTASRKGNGEHFLLLCDRHPRRKDVRANRSSASWRLRLLQLLYGVFGHKHIAKCYFKACHIETHQPLVIIFSALVTPLLFKWDADG